jgi:hypothetical protein
VEQFVIVEAGVLLDGGLRRLQLKGLAVVVVYFNFRALELCELVNYYLSTILSMFFVDFKRLCLIFSFHCSCVIFVCTL